LDWDALPPEVKQRARLRLLEVVSAALAGVHTPTSQATAEAAACLWRGDDATIFWHRLRARPAGAAYANAWFASQNAVQGDNVFSSGRLGLGLVPAALAVAEQSGASGKALLLSIVIGHEVASRAGHCGRDEQSGAPPRQSWEALACAAAAARTLGLALQQVKHALGIAEYHIPNAPLPPRQSTPAIVGQAAAWSAMNGVVAAELAQRGFTGIPSLLGDERCGPAVADLGERYRLVEYLPGQDWASLEDKLRLQAGAGLPLQTVERLLERLYHAHELENVQQVTCLLA
jgi:2-methylcitrate dehydratase PrpD